MHAHQKLTHVRTFSATVTSYKKEPQPKANESYFVVEVLNVIYGDLPKFIFLLFSRQPVCQ